MHNGSWNHLSGGSMISFLAGSIVLLFSEKETGGFFGITI